MFFEGRIEITHFDSKFLIVDGFPGLPWSGAGDTPDEHGLLDHRVSQNINA